ncbi:MAG: acetoacetate--CoA ligase [Deltaproteobacteria bacterium]|nr:acetoacetate--CoA ligase [Deltaproteobacteria bacterium]MBW2112444.1 acetoacetate--CoA ligase [Deltaproteobacteria bacterium]MBW2353273.1 acetoacetate--CoA ligase [Deltaproteobacteria bacterium]HDZ91534.1 acetoacetate--CoA ligase [Deltaproteobacteria bacterium]
MAKLLWQPSEERIRKTNMYRFMNVVNEKYHKDFREYAPLYQWSIDNIPDFWATMWEFAEIRASSPYTEVVDDLTKMPGARWFRGARLNFAENLLRYRDDRVALIFKGEARDATRMTYAELYDEVARVAVSLKEIGVRAGDRVAGFMPNMPQTIVAMLAATSLGATWSSCSPDFGIKGVLDRFGQIKPKVLFTANGYSFKGKDFDSLGRVSEILKEIPSVEKVVVVPYTEEDPDLGVLQRAVNYREFRSADTPSEMEFEQLPADHPLYIMFTSGTTGLPKCMVQSAGGILVHHMKELMLHCDLKREDTIFYFTTCGWMMWNWLTSSLSVGASLVLFDGNPFYPDPSSLWQMAQDEKISIFGTSAGYIAALQNAGVRPGRDYDLTPLKAVLSTGSPLSVEGFEYIYREVKEEIQLASISGGSDINGCFAGGNPMGPVYAGELQCRQLAMKVEAFDENGKPVISQQGELVCTAPSPSMPIYFWDDPEGKKYHAAYFDVYPNVWRHGDFIEINDRGGVVIYGRSDATLNPGGVRIGTAEIYRLVEGMEEIEDSLVVGQSWKSDVRVVLFVKMAEGHELTDELKARIRTLLRKNASPRHVPAKIIETPAVPYTLNMKKVELAVKKVIEGKPVLNKDALSNPDALDFYANLKELEEN